MNVNEFEYQVYAGDLETTVRHGMRLDGIVKDCLRQGIMPTITVILKNTTEWLKEHHNEQA